MQSDPAIIELLNEVLTERILHFDGMSNGMRLSRCRSARRFPSSSRSDVELECAAVERLNRGIALAVDAGDDSRGQYLRQQMPP